VTSPRWPQVKNITSADSIRAFGIPVDDELDGSLTARQFAILPMEGWDGGDDGSATDLVRRRWERFGRSGAGLVWGEATAVRMDGRANPHQLVLSSATVEGIAGLRSLLDPSQVAGLQLTHSGRWAGTPRTAYAHPLLDDRSPGAPVFTDDELDELVEDYVQAAVLAQQAGFDFVDVKHCHGYLLHELLSGFTREGRYGGSFEGRTAFLRTVVEGIRARAPGLAIAMRLSVFDFVPFSRDGEPMTTPYQHAFGGDGTGTGIDLAEPHALLDLCESLGITLVSTTAGSPYYCPHVQRPAYFPPSDGYQPPEDPLVGVARQLAATASLAAAHPALTIVAGGLSYVQDWLPNVAQAVVREGGASVIGLGRMALSYPDLPADVVAGRPLQRRAVCRTFSDCTTAPRNGLVSGCYPLDPFYKDHPDRATLVRVKRA
jgi:NADPH2 dehydrogenase